MREIWVASFTYGTANLSKAQVIKETDKTFQVQHSPERILGWSFLGVRLWKKNNHCFDTPDEALEYLVKAAEGHVQSCQMEVGKALAEHKELVEFLEEMKKVAKEGGECDPDH